MERFRKFLLALLGLSFVLAAVAITYVLTRALWRSFRDLESGVAAAIVVAAASLLASVITVTASRVNETRAENRRDLRARKLPVYEKFIADWISLLLDSKDGLDEANAVALMRDAAIQFTVWASDDVLAAFARLRSGRISNATQQVLEFESVLMEIRSDLGHKNKGLERGDLLRLWVNDIDTYLAAAPH